MSGGTAIARRVCKMLHKMPQPAALPAPRGFGIEMSPSLMPHSVGNAAWAATTRWIMNGKSCAHLRCSSAIHGCFSNEAGSSRSIAAQVFRASANWRSASWPVMRAL